MALAVAACDLISGRSGLVIEPLRLSISNGTTLPITLRVNGQRIGPFAPGTQQDPIDPASLPPAPWHVEALTPSGRVLLTMDVKPGDVWRTTPDAQGRSSSRGAAARADLSCGRLDLWSVFPMGGPAPPQEFPPGDCAP